MCLGCRAKSCWWEKKLAGGLETPLVRSLAFVKDHWEAGKDFSRKMTGSN